MPDLVPAEEPGLPARRILLSDADRARVADVIGDAFAEGRLTQDEYEERLAVAMAARTVEGLTGVLEGLPSAAQLAALAPLVGLDSLANPLAAGQSGQSGQSERPDWLAAASTAPDSGSAIAILGGATRKGEWIVPVQMTAVAVLGGVELDLTAATFADRECEINAVAVLGGVDITVPEGLSVQVDGAGILGGFDHGPGGPADANAPVLKIKGVALLGGVSIKRKRRKGPKGAKGLPSSPRRPELT